MPSELELSMVLYDLVAHERRPCWLDHNGDCQEHGWFGSECAVKRARLLLGLDKTEFGVGARVRLTHPQWKDLTGTVVQLDRTDRKLNTFVDFDTDDEPEPLWFDYKTEMEMLHE